MGIVCRLLSNFQMSDTKLSIQKSVERYLQLFDILLVSPGVTLILKNIWPYNSEGISKVLNMNYAAIQG